MIHNETAIENRLDHFINDSLLIEIKQVTQFLQWFEQCHNCKGLGLVIGDQGTGKTTAIKYCVSKFIEASELSQDCFSGAYYISCLVSCNSVVLRQLILRSLSSNPGCEDKLHSLKLKGWSLIEAFQIRSLTIDNAHLMTDKALMDIIEFSKSTKITLILIGSSKLREALRKLDLLGYFWHKFEFKKLTVEDMVQVMKSLEAFLELPETSELFSPEVISTLYRLSKGNFDMLIHCLSRVICKSGNGEMFQFDKVAFEDIVGSYLEEL